MSRTIYVHAYILDFAITYRNALSIRMCMSTSNSKHGSFLYKSNENTNLKARALMQMYRDVPLMIANVVIFLYNALLVDRFQLL